MSPTINLAFFSWFAVNKWMNLVWGTSSELKIDSIPSEKVFSIIYLIQPSQRDHTEPESLLDIRYFYILIWFSLVESLWFS